MPGDFVVDPSVLVIDRSAVGGIVGSTAYDGRSIYGPITVPGYLWSLQAATGGPRWIAPVADVAHYGEPVAVANGVVYTVDLTGHWPSDPSFSAAAGPFRSRGAA